MHASPPLRVASNVCWAGSVSLWHASHAFTFTYSGSYDSQRYSTLDQITPRNVKTLQMRWALQVKSLEKFEATPLVIDGRMYLTQAPNDVLALDATSGRVFWQYTYEPSPKSRPCCGIVNRGLAILGDTLFMGSIGRTDLPGGDYPTLIRSIREVLFGFGDEATVYPGHGPKTTIGEERRTNPFLQ